MSLSKLESLPNEILLDIFEKHINGVDIFMAFSEQLNSRIDGLIARCQQFRFDFIRCRKDDFGVCINLFPSLIDRIRELALSEWDTPGQIHSFLSFFPSFEPFINLQTLYFHFDTTTTDCKQVERALCSLSNLKNLSTLSIEVADGSTIYNWSGIIERLFYLPTLKQFSIVIETYIIDWPSFKPTSSNIEHLNIRGVYCIWNILQSIVRCATNLQYLNVRLIEEVRYLFQVKTPTKLDYAPMPYLQTLILHFDKNISLTFDMVAQFLRTAPNLYRLEITGHDALLNASAWEQFITNALPRLTHFCLKMSPSCLEKRNLEEVVISFQTLFWIGKINFHVLIMDEEQLLNDTDTICYVFGRKNRTLNMQQSLKSNKQNTEFRMALVHPINNSISPTNTITRLHFYEKSSLLSSKYFFNNVRRLSLAYLDKDLAKWISKYVNYLKIEELDISQCTNDLMKTVSLLTLTKNIKSLKLNDTELILYHESHIGTNEQLKSINLSCTKRTFNEDMIQIIRRLFPRIEHMVIDQLKLDYLPMISTYLPHLRSLTFNMIDENFILCNKFSQTTRDYRSPLTVSFIFRRDGFWFTFWLDSATFTEIYWSHFGRKSPTINESRKKRLKFY